LLAVVTASCSHDAYVSAASSTGGQQTWSMSNVDADGSATVTLLVQTEARVQRTRFKIAPGVEMQLRWATGRIDMSSAPVPDGANGFFIKGQAVRVEDKELTIGGRSFGKVAASSTVEILPEAVIVDGERRGAVP
jgi:hypothetical protein